MQFVVTAFDYTDSEALHRRMQHRDAHLAGIQEMMADGNFLSGGAILDDDGNMIGSTLHLEFPDRLALEEWLQGDPYVTGKVWERIDIRPARLVRGKTS